MNKNFLVTYIRKPWILRNLHSDDEKMFIDTLRRHFQEAVLPPIMPVVQDVVKELFNEFINSEEYTKSKNDQNAYTFILQDFGAILEAFMTYLSNVLTQEIISRDTSDQKFQEKIDERLRRTGTFEEQLPSGNIQAKKMKYFAYLCKKATSLFERILFSNTIRM